MANISEESLQKAVEIINNLEEDRELFATSYEDTLKDLKSLNKQLNELKEDLRLVKKENELLRTKEQNSTALLREFYFANKELEKQLKEAKAIQSINEKANTITGINADVAPSIKESVLNDELDSSEAFIDKPESSSNVNISSTKNLGKGLNLSPTYNINYYV